MSLAQQHDIDFLPARYREQNVRRRLNVWRLGVVVTCGTLVGIGALHQWTVRWTLERELSAIQARYDAQKASILQLNELEDGLDQAQSEAELFAYLSHPWPRTQMLAVVLHPMPVDIRLQELKVVREVVDRPAATSPAAPAPPPDPLNPMAGTPEQSPLVADLEALRKTCDPTEIAVILEGTVISSDCLKRYLASVAQSPLIASTELQSLAADEGGTRFRARLEFIPGIGQPGGPSTAPAEAPAAAPAIPETSARQPAGTALGEEKLP